MLIHVLGSVSQLIIEYLLWVHLRFILFYYYFNNTVPSLKDHLTHPLLAIFPFSLRSDNIRYLAFFFLPVPETPSRCHCKADLFSKAFIEQQIELLHVVVMHVLDTGFNLFQSHLGVGCYKNAETPGILACLSILWENCFPST